MSGIQAIGVLIAASALFFLLYIGFRVVSHQLDKRFPTPVEVHTKTAQTDVTTPPTAWWDEFQALQSRFNTLQLDVQAKLAATENNLKLARSAEERARRMQRSVGYDEEDDELLPALPAPENRVAPVEVGNWDEEETAPVGQPSSRLTNVQMSALERRRRLS